MRRLFHGNLSQYKLSKQLFRPLVLWLILTITWLTACGAPPPSPTLIPPPALAVELIFYDWATDMPQSVLDAFTVEYGVKVNYVTYEPMAEAQFDLIDGEMYDVVVLESNVVTLLAPEGLLLGWAEDVIAGR